MLSRSSQKKIRRSTLVTGLKFDKLVMQEKNTGGKRKNVFHIFWKLTTANQQSTSIPVDQIYMEDDGTALLNQAGESLNR